VEDKMGRIFLAGNVRITRDSRQTKNFKRAYPRTALSKPHGVVEEEVVAAETGWAGMADRDSSLRSHRPADSL
jgi:purine nucleoside permease